MANKDREHRRTPRRIAIGNRFDDELARLNFGVPQLAQQVGCSKRTLYYQLEGSSALNAETLADLSELGFDILYIATGRRIIVAEH